MMRGRLAVQATSHLEADQPASKWLGFLSPEDVVAWQDRDELMVLLAEGFAANDDEPAFVAANRLALEAFRGRELPLAAQICRLQIGYAMTRLRTGEHDRLALLGLQPVINLIRLNGYAADLRLALDGLAQLEKIADGLPVRVLGLDLPRSGAGRASAARLRSLARTNCLVETAKILWRRGMTADMLARCSRLMGKWPRSVTHGPFQAAEAQWLADALGALRSGGLPTVPALRRICSLHVLSQSLPDPPPGAARLGAELFASRAEACRGMPATAAARDLASLGDSLLWMGDWTSGLTCLEEAHETAGRVDPPLANLIRSRWLAHADGKSPVPPERTCHRLHREDLAAFSSLAAARFGS
jgi:hypothetical protein